MNNLQTFHEALEEARKVYESGQIDDVYADWLCRGNANRPITNGDQLIIAMEREDNLEEFLDYYVTEHPFFMKASKSWMN